jgi:hypothetical protein
VLNWVIKTCLVFMCVYKCCFKKVGIWLCYRSCSSCRPYQHRNEFCINWEQPMTRFCYSHRMEWDDAWGRRMTNDDLTWLSGMSNGYIFFKSVWQCYISSRNTCTEYKRESVLLSFGIRQQFILVGYLTTLFVARLYSVECWDERWMMNWLLFRRNPESPERGWRLSLSSFEPSTSRIKTESVVATPARYVG